jgi:hypothetical protein
MKIEQREDVFCLDVQFNRINLEFKQEVPDQEEGLELAFVLNDNNIQHGHLEFHKVEKQRKKKRKPIGYKI